jgi:Fe-S cluster assembly protein SufD
MGRTSNVGVIGDGNEMTTLTQDHRIQDDDTALKRLLSIPRQYDESAWLTERRDAARARFIDLGLPTRRDEEWRLINLAPLNKLNFSTVVDGPAVTDADIASTMIAGCTGPRLVFVNGRLAPALSELGALPTGLTVTSFAQASGAAAQMLERHLGACASGDEALTSLNTACFEDGTLVTVDEQVRVEQPLLMLHLTVGPETIATHPRTLIVAASGSHVTVVEEYTTVGTGTYLTNAVTEVLVGQGADVHHYLLERESEEAFNISTLSARQEGGSTFTSHSALLGGGLVRNNIHPVLAGEDCESVLNGLYLGRANQCLDSHMRVEHTTPNCRSRQYYNGILDDRSHGIFSGRIVVSQDAQKTDAIQHNASLLLSDNARADAKPQLEIYADDVRCTHGATIGELDEDAIFYLRARGLNESSARSLLIYAFAEEGLARMDLEPIRSALQTALLDRLPGRDLLQKIMAGEQG